MSSARRASEAVVQGFDLRAGIYEHYEGGPYLVLGVARNDDTGEPLVVYVRLYERAAGIPMAARPFDFFVATVNHDGSSVPCFRWLGDHDPGASGQT